MSINEIDSRVKELRELRRMADELAAEIESIQDSLKEQMQARGLDTSAGQIGRLPGNLSRAAALTAPP